MDRNVSAAAVYLHKPTITIFGVRTNTLGCSLSEVANIVSHVADGTVSRTLQDQQLCKRHYSATTNKK
jgi:hypothetical protein